MERGLFLFFFSSLFFLSSPTFRTRSRADGCSRLRTDTSSAAAVAASRLAVAASCGALAAAAAEEAHAAS